MAHEKQSIEDVLRRLPVSRRGFISRVVAGAFVAPAISSVALPSVFAAGAQYSSSSGSSSSSSSSGSSSASPPPTSSVPAGSSVPEPCSTPGGTGGPGGGELVASADAFLRHDSMNTNEGGNIRLRVGVQPISRAIVQFDQAAMASQLPGVSQVLLIVTIANNHNTWGQTDDHAVCAHPLREVFVEGNGRQALMPDYLVQRGTGPGATWRSPEDPEVGDRRPPRGHRNVWTNVVVWNGGSYGPSTAQPVPHINLMTGSVAFDVTADVYDGAVGWLLKIDDERDRDRPLPLGNERFAGVVEYYSVQGAQDAGDMNLAPRLRFI